MKRKIQILSLALLCLLFSSALGVSSEPENTENTQSKKAENKEVTNVQQINHDEEGESADEKVKHTWKKVDRSKIGGKEENITLVQTVKFHGQIQEVIWCRTDNQSTFALGYEGEIYFSRNHGNSWKNLQPFVLKSTNRNWGISWKFTSMIQSPGDHDNIIISSDSNNNWVTADCGETWTLMNDKLNLYGLKFHPHNAGKALALSRKICHEDAAQNCMEYNILYLTTDHGKTWKPIKTHVFKYIWGREAGFSWFIPVDSIFITRQDNMKKAQPKYMKHFSKGYTISTYYSHDSFKTEKLLVKRGFKMMISKCCLFVTKPTDTSSTLVVSEVWNTMFKFREVNILSDRDYSSFRVINDMQGFKTYMYATREIGEQGFHVSDLLKADHSSYNYTTVHKNLVVNAQSEVTSFDEIQAFHGIAIMNVYDERMLDYIQRMGDQSGKGVGLEQANKFIHTKISYNDGANWGYLKPPSVDSEGKTYPECATCSLHLHTQENNEFPMVYSHKSAPGIIIGVGNVGLHLSFDVRELATFISEDGGLSWREILKGVYIYEIGDQGGLIVAAPYNSPTNIVLFTHNYGKNFQYVKYTNITTVVSNIVIEPTNKSHQFFIVSSTKTENREDGVLVHLDFNEYHSRKCEGHKTPGDEKSDYEKIVPHSYKNAQCLFGRNGYYIRKKADSKCINANFIEFFHMVRACKCAEQDWECDAGYKKAGDDESTTCIPISQEEEITTPPVKCRFTYEISNGYRKVPGNHCKGGVTHPQKKIPCPGGLGIFGLMFVYLIRITMFGALLFTLFIGGRYVMEKFNSDENYFEGISKNFFNSANSNGNKQGYEGLGQNNTKPGGLMEDDGYGDDEEDDEDEEDQDQGDI